jgi:hypothetical protein
MRLSGLNHFGGLMTVTETQTGVEIVQEQLIAGTAGTEWKRETQQIPANLWQQHKELILQNAKPVKTEIF